MGENSYIEKNADALEKENRELRSKLQEAEDTLEAIRTGEIDAIAVSGKNGPEIYTLKTADKTYRMLVETMNEGAIALNRDGTILYSNSQFAKLVKYPLPEIIGSSFIKIVSPEYLDVFYVLEQKGWNQSCKGELVIQNSDNDKLNVLLSLNTYDEGEGPILGIIITDLTELKKTHSELQIAQQELKAFNAELEKKIWERTEALTMAKRELERSNEELNLKNLELVKSNNDLDNFIYTASHDLKAPVSNIEGLINTLESLLEEGAGRTEINEIIDMILHSISRFKLTIIDLTEITNVQRNEGREEELVDCKEVIDDVTDSISAIIKKESATIHVDVSLCAQITFSRKNIKSIIYNLVSNAIKYRSPDRDPQVFISFENIDDCVFLTVKDNGLGMRENEKVKIFSMFKRLHNHVEGTGVGLYLVKRMVDNAGGKIEVHSKLGEGTTFKIFLMR